MNITEQICMLEIPAVGTMGNPTSIFPTVLIGESECWLVDACFPGQVNAILEAIRAQGLAPEQIAGLLITHHDIDHIGSAAALKQVFPSIRVYCHELDRPFIQGDQTPLKLAAYEKEMEGKPEEERQFLYKITHGFQQSYLPVDEIVTEGQVLPVGGGMTVIHTPGHTPGHICLYNPTEKFLVAGDTLRVADGALALMVDDNNADPLTFRQSIQKLTSFDIEQVVCYHGGYFNGPVNDRLRELLAE